MTLYTRQGDDGTTQRADGTRVSKASVQCEALGTLDELSAHLGRCAVAARAARADEIAADLERAQQHVMAVGACVAAPGSGGGRMTGEPTSAMERRIDEIIADVGTLKAFLLPGGAPLACDLHVARTVCRRAERAIVALTEQGTELPPTVLRYVNRLGDLLFCLARLANHQAGCAERTPNA